MARLNIPNPRSADPELNRRLEHAIACLEETLGEKPVTDANVAQAIPVAAKLLQTRYGLSQDESWVAVGAVGLRALGIDGPRAARIREVVRHTRPGEEPDITAIMDAANRPSHRWWMRWQRRA